METVMNKLFYLGLFTALVALPSLAKADLAYNAERDATLKNLQAVESASVNMHYQCGKHALIISAFATESEINGRLASVTGKIVSDDAVFDVSKDLSLAISRHNLLTGEISVLCNADKGAFQMKFSPNAFDTSGRGQTTVNIFADGHVEASRVIKK